MSKFEVGQKVKIGSRLLRAHPPYCSWEGIVKNYSIYADDPIIELLTTKADEDDCIKNGRQFSVYESDLEPIIDIIEFSIPDNKTICPKCKSLECNGLARLECLAR